MRNVKIKYLSKLESTETETQKGIGLFLLGGYMPEKKKNSQRDIKANNRKEFMTDDEITRVNDYVSELINAKGDMAELYSEWQEIEKYYQNEQEEKKNMPNTKVNIINSNVEGQASMIIDQDLAIMTKGESAGDDDFAEDARIGLEWTFRKNYIKRPLKSFVRKYSKFGIGCFSLYFDKNAINGFGLTKIYSKPLTNIFIDGKIKDPLRYQEAEWIAEAETVSKTQLTDWYGEEKAESVVYGPEVITDTTIFDVDDSHDDRNSATLIKRYSRQDTKLRLEEFTGDGSLMYDSHKSGDRKSNQRDSEEKITSYYKHVQDKYPIFLAFLYEREGNMWSFGDGKLLIPLQKLINNLYDNILICSKPNLRLVDVRSDIDVDDLDKNSNATHPYDGEQLGGGEPVRTIAWGTTNGNWWNLITAIHNEAQRVTRFADIMTGQAAKGTDTATEAAIQQQQGSKSTDEKKANIQCTMEEMCEYILGIMMEKYERAKSFKVADDSSEYKWIDFRKMANVPVKIPATKKFRKEYMSANNGQIPQWELLTNGDGKPETKNLELDIQINIGAGLPKNKAFITKFLQDISQLILISKTGQQKPAIFWGEMREFLKKFVGLPLKDDEELAQTPLPVQGVQPAQTTQPNANAPLGQGGGVQTSQTQGVKAV